MIAAIEEIIYRTRSESAYYTLKVVGDGDIHDTDRRCFNLKREKEDGTTEGI